MFNQGMAGGGQSPLHNVLMQRAMGPKMPSVHTPAAKLPSMRFPSGKIGMPHGVRTISPIFRPTALLPSL